MLKFPLPMGFSSNYDPNWLLLFPPTGISSKGWDAFGSGASSLNAFDEFYAELFYNYWLKFVGFLGAFFTTFFFWGGGLNASPYSGNSLKLNFLLPPPIGT